MSSRIIFELVAGFVIIAGPAVAQTPSDMSTIYSGVIFSVACFVVLILAGILIRRFSSRRKNDLADDAGIDLMGLRQKNLLTPEEMKMVSAAIARRVAEKDTQQKRTGAARLSTSTLLHDPEVLRLQELAQARREGKAETSTGKAFLTEQSPQQAETRPVSEPVFPGDPIPAEDNSDVPTNLDESLDDVVLPPEVQQLADAGILSLEEVKNVKRRLKNRQSSEVE